MTMREVMAFGAFDGIHTGHLHYMRESRKLGDRLVVVIARDESEWKFPRRFDIPELERKRLVESLGIADTVVLGSRTDALERIRERRPAVVAITDYSPIDKEVLQRELRHGGLEAKVVRIKRYRPKIYDRVYGYRPVR